MRPLCSGGKELEPLGPGSSIDLEGAEHNPRDHKKFWVRVLLLQFPGAHHPVTHYNCVHNQEVALRNRVLFESLIPTARGIWELRRTAKYLKKLLPKRLKQHALVQPFKYSGRKKEKYIIAAEKYLQRGCLRKEGYVNMFVKFEKKVFKSEKPNPNPRAIQFRRAVYCMALAQYIGAIEHELYAFKGDGVYFPNTRLIGKGLSQGERAMLLNRKLKKFGDPKIISIDITAFDQSCHAQTLSVEHSIYCAMTGNEKELQWLLSMQINNIGYTSAGIRYSCKGRRMSGDMNTALGNCLIMIVCAATVCRGYNYELLDDGDDCLLILEKTDADVLLPTLPGRFAAFGMRLKIENVATSMEEIEWCQSHPVQVTRGAWRFVRDYRKVLPFALGGSKYFTVSNRRRLVNTIGLAELALNRGVPVLQEFALALVRNSGTEDVLALEESDSLFYRVRRELKGRPLSGVKSLPVTDLARASFARAFGLLPSEQVQMEEDLRNLTFTVQGGSDVPVSDVDIDMWFINHRAGGFRL